MDRPVRLLVPVLLAAATVVSAQEAPDTALTARLDPHGQVLLAENGRPILRYNERTVPLPEGYLDEVSAANQRYARPRSGYVHPLYGLDGEALTLDWSRDHPHHRGIYWAWPEVQWGERQGDLHALQVVFSRPVGEPRLESGPGFARLAAHNLWLWEDERPVVFERVVLTAHAAAADGSRAVDLDLAFTALVPGVTLARRETKLYGGLNVRLAPVRDLALRHHADPPDAAPPRRAWSLAIGTWEGGKRAMTLALLEHPANPGFPGDWITYEDLPWFQPAFPPAGTRHALELGTPLVLRYRFLILPGTPDPATLAAAFDAFAATGSALDPEPPEK